MQDKFGQDKLGQETSGQQMIGGAGGAAGDMIADATDASFAEAVIEASQKQPVIVDFWAPWCGPCKQMTPLLEKAVMAAKGAVKLVKINVDENPAVAQQLRIQSIPAVFAFHKGQPVDGFMGAVPESELASFVARVSGQSGPSAADELLAQGKQAMKEGDIARAAQAFGQALQEDPSNPEVVAGLARCFVERNHLAEAKELISHLPEDLRQHDEIASVEAAIALKERAGEAAGEVDALRAKVAANPDDHQARIDLAKALAAVGDGEGAVSELIESIRRDREWNDAAARKELLKLFEAFGPTDPVTVGGRRKLSSTLFA